MAGAPVWAHHSVAGVFDMSKKMEVVGELSNIKFVNPHGTLTVTVKNADGTTTDWTFITGSATALANRGISRVGPNALKVGEKLTVNFIPARNGHALGDLQSIVRADGKVISMSTDSPR
jgi:hypothetical protein